MVKGKLRRGRPDFATEAEKHRDGALLELVSCRLPNTDADYIGEVVVKYDGCLVSLEGGCHCLSEYYVRPLKAGELIEITE